MNVRIPDPRKLPIKRPGEEPPKRLKRVRGTPEDDLQAGIVAMFEARKAPDTLGFSVPNGGYRSWKAARTMKRTGQMPGITDLVFINLFGLAFFMEVKAKRGSLRPEQKGVRDWCLARNIPWVVVRSVADAEAWLLKNKLIAPLAA